MLLANIYLKNGKIDLVWGSETRPRLNVKLLVGRKVQTAGKQGVPRKRDSRPQGWDKIGPQ